MSFDSAKEEKDLGHASDIHGAGRHGLYAVAMQVLRLSNFNRNAAAQTLEARIRADVQLHDAALTRVARDLIRLAEFSNRNSLSRPVQNPNAALPGMLARLEQAKGILDSYLLRSGIRLGDAYLEDLWPAAQDHLHQIAGHKRSRSYLLAIAAKTLEGKRVRECWSEADALALWRKLSP